MKYIISEQQVERLKQTILDYFDENLTPVDGWETTEAYNNELNSYGYEIFMFLEDPETYEEQDHIWYTTHKNPSIRIPKNKSPLVAIPDSDFNSLEGYFGDIWKPIFIEWFQKNTGLPVKTVDKFT